MTKKFIEPKNPVGTVAELFAGVGGFRIGLAAAGWKTVFSNQWEPSTKVQHASSVYIANFGEEGHSSEDIAKVKKIPKKFDLLVGGFPCQDYSVAKTLSHAKGLRGKKGVLWWEILRLVELHKPKLIFLENVDRLLKSPASQRGRDFAVMLRTLGDAGYAIEWRVVNSAEYGFPQRRIRVFIIAKKVNKNLRVESPYEVITKTGILARALPIITEQLDAIPVEIQQDVQELSRTFNKKLTERSPFLNSGFYFRGIAHTLKTIANPTLRTKFYTLGDVLQDEWEVSDDYFVSPAQLDEWRFLKGAKSIERIHKSSGVTYKYAEGAMSFPDSLDKPSRTILTGEGGTSPSRFKHVIDTEKGFRRLTPVELERLSGFPDDWTRFDSFGRELSPTKRAFFIGNALVVGLVESIGKILAQEI